MNFINVKIIGALSPEDANFVCLRNVGITLFSHAASIRKLFTLINVKTLREIIFYTFLSYLRYSFLFSEFI